LEKHVQKIGAPRLSFFSLKPIYAHEINAQNKLFIHAIYDDSEESVYGAFDQESNKAMLVLTTKIRDTQPMLQSFEFCK